MPKLLEDLDIDVIGEQVELSLNQDEERIAANLAAPVEYQGGDLSDGGNVGEARIFPSRDHVQQTQGRATARLAWSWNGTETTIPLAWNPDGTDHDGGRRYLAKRHCTCCRYSGFKRMNGRPLRCPECVYTNCARCQAGADTSKIIPCFYLRKEDVPNQAKFYGTIPCFLPFCQRQGEMGFLSEEDMRIHARSRHRMEYAAHMETVQATKNDEVEQLRDQVNLLLTAALGNVVQPVVESVPQVEAVEEPMAEPVAAEPHVHLYKGKTIGSPCKFKGCTATRSQPFKARKKAK